MNYFEMLRTYLTARLNITDERGATAVEYALLVALIAGVIGVAVTGLATRITGAFNRVSIP